jgi:hypothetical protein
MDGGELLCRVCGLPQDEPIWGSDGQCPTYDLCACCGCEFGYEDSSPEGIRRQRERWLATGTWCDPTKRPADWKSEQQLSKVPRYYFRILPGLPGTGDPPVRFNASGGDRHTEGFVVELTLAGGERWVGNFQMGAYGKSVVVPLTGRTEHALIVAGGAAYVVEPETRTLVRTFGGTISDVLSLPDRDAMIFGNGLWLECTGPEGLRWRSRRISWDGMTDVSLRGERLHGLAYDPMDDSWAPFEVDVDTGEVTGGSYPKDLP